MKKPKLTLKELHVKSFNTTLEDQEKKTIDGGTSPVCLSIVSYILVTHVCISVLTTNLPPKSGVPIEWQTYKIGGCTDGPKACTGTNP